MICFFDLGLIIKDEVSSFTLGKVAVLPFFITGSWKTLLSRSGCHRLYSLLSRFEAGCSVDIYLPYVCLQIGVGGLCGSGGAVVIVGHVFFQLVPLCFWRQSFLFLFFLSLCFCFCPQLPLGLQYCKQLRDVFKNTHVIILCSFVIQTTPVPLFCMDRQLASCGASAETVTGLSRSLSMAPISFSNSASSVKSPRWGGDEPAELWLWRSVCLVLRDLRFVSWLGAGGPSLPEVVLPLVSWEEAACIAERPKLILDLLSWLSESGRYRLLPCRPPMRAAPLLDEHNPLEFGVESKSFNLQKG